MRSLVAVLAIGVIVLFSAISVADAIAAIRRQRAAKAALDIVRPTDDVVAPGPDWVSPRPAATNGRRGKVSARR
jgi:hypothetical protein